MLCFLKTETHYCAFAASLTARLALGDSLEAAARHAKRFVAAALGRAPGLGRGTGPIGHL